MIKLVLVLLALVLAVNADVWIESALAFQRDLSQTVPVNELSRPCAHFSFNNPDALPPIIRQYQELLVFRDIVVFNSQTLNHTQLLNAGVRHLQIEVHYIPEFGATLVCHHQPSLLQFCPFLEGGSGMTCEEIAGLVNLDIHTGCTADARTWEDELAEIADWVLANPNDVVVIEIIDHVTEEASANATQFSVPFIDLLGSATLTVTELSSFSGWPTPAELSALNKSLIVSGSTFPDLAEYMVDLQTNVQFPDNMAVNFTGTCTVTPQFTSYYESLMRLVINLLGYDIHYDESDETGSFDADLIEEAVTCGYSACVDLVDDTKLAANIWTWPSGVSNIACQENQCAILAKDDTRWSQQPCNGTFAFACKDELGAWIVTGPSGTKNIQDNCPEGYTFSVPRTGSENAALKLELANNPEVNGVWLDVDLVLDSSHQLCSAVHTPTSSASMSFSSLFVTLGALVVSVIFALF